MTLVITLEFDDLRFDANDADSVVPMRAIADGSMNERAFANRIRKQGRA